LSTPGLNPDLSPSSGPGARPYELINVFALNQSPTAEELSDGGHVGPAANVKNLSFDLPPGMVANAATFPRCSQEAFSAGACATVSQVGVAKLGFSAGLPEGNVPIFNLVPPPGRPVQFAFHAQQSAVHIDVRLRNGSDYGATASVTGLNEAAGLLTSSVRIWGVPGDPGHDALRFSGNGTPTPGEYPDPPPYRPLLSNPTSCNGPLVTTMEVTTWQPGPNVFGAPFEAPGTNSCNQLDFSPTVEVKPTTNLADSPTGLDFSLHVPQNQDPEGSASGHLRSIRVALPAGLDVNPAAAGGLGTCSLEQIGLAASANERQLLRYDLPPVNFSGTFRVSFDGRTTAPIAATAGSATVAAALETLPGLAGNITVGGASGGWIVTFVGALAGTDMPLLTGTVTDNPSQIIAVTGQGGSFELASGGVSTAPLPFNADAKEIQAALRTIPALGLGNLYPGNVFVDSAGSEEFTRFFKAIFAGDLAGTKPVLSATSALTGPGAGVTFTPGNPPPPRSLSVATFGGNAPGAAQFNPAPAACPDASKIGIARIDSPAVLDHPIFGDVYLASPRRNPFGSLLAIYVTATDLASGIVVKVPGRIETDPASGRLLATFTEAPQLPFEDLRLEFFKGTAAPLKTGLACGTYAVQTELTPWGAPETAVSRPGDAFAISKGAGGAACVTTPAAAPDQTRFEAGTVDPSAGIYSPFVLKLIRPDGSRLLSAIDTTLPTGLLAKLAGIPLCSDASIAAAAGRTAAQEQGSSSCPAASRVGSVAVGAGAGPSPYNLSGSAFLSGPYRGAPLSLAIVTPVLAGAFDLGTVVVRASLSVDSQNLRVHAVSDPLPTTLQGIPLDLRSLVLNLDAPGFTKNPTSCNGLAFSGLQNGRFQVGDCRKLAFKPKLELALKGGTKPGAHPALKATLSFPAKGNSANVAGASLTLPKALRLDKARIKATCSPAQFASGTCPAASVYGSAKASTPLLAAPLQGPVYLRRGSAKAPAELIADLGGPFDVVISGRLEATKAGVVSANFEDLPDAPISKFVLEMAGAKQGLLRSAVNLCARPGKATVALDGHNGVGNEQSTPVTSSCKKAGKGGKAKKRSGSGAVR
jgi:hypothetical protein